MDKKPHPIISLEEYKKKVFELIEHDKHYYDECKPIISDYEYDLLIKEIETYEKAHPEHILPNSPTKRVGESITKGFVQKSHSIPMLSLSNTYSEKELEDFIKRVHKLSEKKELEFCLELKMDGTALSLRYEKGIFVRALTRGNGRVGDDVTANVKTIKTLPLQISGSNIPDFLEIRAEVFIHKPIFEALNTKRQEEGYEPWANPRNAAAGSLKLLDPSEVARRKLDLICYAIAEGKTDIFSQHEMHKYLRKLGLPVSKEEHFAKCKTLKEILQFAEKVQKQRDTLTFEIDGIVIKVDDLHLHKVLGVTGKSPRYSVAYKFAPEQAITKIKDITVQVGRTGVLTPVAELEPVRLAGSQISRATLHNQDEIKRKDIRIGDTVVIEKGGDVIPKVVSSKKEKRDKSSTTWLMPKHCPICQTAVIHKKEEVAVRCPNPKCLGRRQRHLTFFASKHAMDIENLGEKVIKQLIDKGLISRASDIYLLDEAALSKLEGFKEKSIHNLLSSIEKSKQCRLSRLIMALEIPYVGAETAEILAKEALTIEKLMLFKEEDLIQMEGVGEKVAEAIFSFFQDPSNIEEIKLLLSHGVKPQKEKEKQHLGHVFDNKTFVLTGSLKNYTRSQAKDLIKERGGKTSSSVSKNTDFVLVGEEPGSKYDKAKSLGVKILSEEEFEKML